MVYEQYGVAILAHNNMVYNNYILGLGNYYIPCIFVKVMNNVWELVICIDRCVSGSYEF